MLSVCGRAKSRESHFGGRLILGSLSPGLSVLNTSISCKLIYWWLDFQPIMLLVFCLNGQFPSYSTLSESPWMGELADCCRFSRVAYPCGVTQPNALRHRTSLLYTLVYTNGRLRLFCHRPHRPIRLAQLFLGACRPPPPGAALLQSWFFTARLCVALLTCIMRFVGRSVRLLLLSSSLEKYFGDVSWHRAVHVC